MQTQSDLEQSWHTASWSDKRVKHLEYIIKGLNFTPFHNFGSQKQDQGPTWIPSRCALVIWQTKRMICVDLTTCRVPHLSFLSMCLLSDLINSDMEIKRSHMVLIARSIAKKTFLKKCEFKKNQSQYRKLPWHYICPGGSGQLAQGLD